MPDHTPNVSFLENVQSTLEDRKNQYGTAEELFTHIAKRWSLTLSQAITPAQVAICMMDLKMARLAHDPKHHDSLMDIVGYANCLADLKASGKAFTP
ncbi:MAG: hypothetical protein J0G29_02475 [Alphaproteobacteria bacterium]|nr:hypothetical protein [Alphaproteobacteria bacterium]OJV45480.1 MAG: hypothetical protein BGO28_05135 [Alphaproteobacteria bacterium 43-37]